MLGFGVAILAFGILSTCFSAGGSLLIWLVGIPFIALGIESARIFARVERWRATFVDRRPLVAHPYRPLPGLPRSPYGPWLRQWAEAEFLDANRWRDVVYVLILFPLAILEFMVALFLWVAAIAFVVAPLVAAGIRAAGAPRFGGEVPAGVAAAMVIGVIVGVVLIPVAASASRGLMTLHRAVVEGLLCVDPTDALRQDVERLRGSRSAALELEASELRRIERDLHDGAQQRLVALAIDLGLAEERIDTDPTSAKTLVAGARAQATPGACRAARARPRRGAGHPRRPRPRGCAWRCRWKQPDPDRSGRLPGRGRAAPAGRRARGLFRGRRIARERGEAQLGDALRRAPRSRRHGPGRRGAR